MFLQGTLIVRKLLWSSLLSVLGTAYRNSELLNYTYTTRYKTKTDIKSIKLGGSGHLERHLGKSERKMSMDIFEFHIVFRYESFQNKEKIILNKSSPNLKERRKAAWEKQKRKQLNEEGLILRREAPGHETQCSLKAEQEQHQINSNSNQLVVISSTQERDWLSKFQRKQYASIEERTKLNT